MAAVLAELFTHPHASTAAKDVAIGGAVATILCLGFSIWSYFDRAHLVYEFRATAFDLATRVVQQDLRSLSKYQDDRINGTAESNPNLYVPGLQHLISAPQDGESREKLLAEIRDYQMSLARLGAMPDADAIGLLARSLRVPDLLQQSEARNGYTDSARMSTIARQLGIAEDQ